MSFELSLQCKIAFGANKVDEIQNIVEILSPGKNVVIVTDATLKKLGVTHRVVKGFDASYQVTVFSEVTSEPTVYSIDKAAKVIRQKKANVVIGLGGGSAMDVAKTAALVAQDSYETEHYELCKHPFKSRDVKTIMIPTTSGTGAEVTSTVVFTNSKGAKVWGWSYDMVPDIALLDSSLTVKLPAHLTAATGLDALVHAIDATTGNGANEAVKLYAYRAIALVSAHLLTAIKEPTNTEARDALSLAACFGGLAVEIGGTGISHTIGHALGTVGHIHKGRAVTIGLYETYAENAKANPAAFAEVARVLGVVGEYENDLGLALAGERQFQELVTATGLKLSLAGDGLTIADLGKFHKIMLSAENAPMRKKNCRYFTDEELYAIGKRILER